MSVARIVRFTITPNDKNGDCYLFAEFTEMYAQKST